MRRSGTITDRFVNAIGLGDSEPFVQSTTGAPAGGHVPEHRTVGEPLDCRAAHAGR
jgi:hypothetical protein